MADSTDIVWWEGGYELEASSKCGDGTFDSSCSLFDID